MIKNFSLSHYRFTLIPKTLIHMPRFNKGNVLRGAFGSSLRRLVCVMDRDTKCIDCLLKEKCAYTLIFDPIGINPAKRLQNVPRGYVLNPPVDEESEYSSDRPFSFEMILIGDRINYLPYVIVPLLELGKVGFGLNRGRFLLRDIRVIKNETPMPLRGTKEPENPLPFKGRVRVRMGLFSDETFTGLRPTKDNENPLSLRERDRVRVRLFSDENSESIYDHVSNTVKNINKPITGHDLLERAETMDQHRILLHFLTPTRIRYNPTGEKGKSEVVRAPEFHHIIRRLRDRINALSITYCDGPIDVDFKGIAERAMAVKTTDVNLRWVEIRRKSRTQHVEHDQSGFIGSITFEGDLTEFLPLIILGEYVHVGEDAVFGNGWYRIF